MELVGDCWTIVDTFLSANGRHQMAQVSKAFQRRQAKHLDEAKREQAARRLVTALPFWSLQRVETEYYWPPCALDDTFGRGFRAVTYDTFDIRTCPDGLGNFTVRLKNLHDVSIRCPSGWYKELTIDMAQRWADQEEQLGPSDDNEKQRRMRLLLTEVRLEMGRWIVSHF